MNLFRLPRRGYVTQATPVEPMARLSKILGKDVNLFVKRDDMLPGAAGGNKTRKLDFAIAEALNLGADTIITCGAVQSNHCRLTLAWSVKEGLDCHLVLEERVKGSYSPEASGNNFLYQLMGAKTISVKPGGSNMLAAMEELADKLKAEGRKPYIVPGGASNAVGATGYAVCAQELIGQLYDAGLDIDAVVVPSGSAGTHAGMLVGICGTNANLPVYGINVSRTKEDQEKIVRELVAATAEHVGVKTLIADEAVVCFGDYVGPGYSLPTDAMVEAVKLTAQNEGILLDPVYSGKAMAGLIDLVRKDFFKKGQNILFLHTGGSPALFAYMDTFR